MAKKLFVTSKVKEVIACAAGVTTFESLEGKIEMVKKLKLNMVVVHCLTNDLANFRQAPPQKW